MFFFFSLSLLHSYLPFFLSCFEEREGKSSGQGEGIFALVVLFFLSSSVSLSFLFLFSVWTISSYFEEGGGESSGQIVVSSFLLSSFLYPFLPFLASHFEEDGGGESSWQIVVFFLSFFCRPSYDIPFFLLFILL